MAKFGIDPTSLALKPSTLIQDRAGRESRAQQASQYQRTRQDAKDRFAESMASQEASRKADFAKTQFMANHNMELQRAKTKAGLLEDMAKEDKRQQENLLKQKQTIDKDINTKAWKAALDSGDASTYSQYQDLIRKTLYPETVQQAPQFQPAGAEGGYDLRTEQPQQNSGQPQYELTDPYTQMQPTVVGGEDSYVMGKAEPEYPVARETTLAGINKQALDEAVAALPATQPKPAPKPQVPKEVAGTDYEDKYTLLQDELKNAPKVLRKDFTKTGVFGKAKKFDQKGYSAAIKASNSAKRKTKKEMADIVFDAKKAKKAEQKELKPTYAQKKAEQKSKKNLALNKKMFLNGIKRGKMVSDGEWVRIKTKEDGYTAAMGMGLDVYDPDVQKAIEGLKGDTPYIQSAINPNTGQKIYSKDGGKTWYDNSTGERIQ